jgi:valyl-tRNA synthetase
VELAKAQLASADEAVQRGTRRTLIRVLEATLRLAHPVIPFITEELWQSVKALAGKTGESICIAPYPRAQPERIDAAADAEVAALKTLINAARNLRGESGVSPAEKVALIVVGDAAAMTRHTPYMLAIARLSEIRMVATLPAGPAPAAMIGATRLMLDIKVDLDAERARLGKEIARIDGELSKARAKLANQSFTAHAPAAVVRQEEVRADAFETTLKKLHEQLAQLQ